MMKQKQNTMKSIILNTILLLCLNYTTSTAQTKKEMYCDENIVWAGSTEIDFVIDADSNINWRTYKISGLGHHFRQFSKDLKPNIKPLNEIIIQNADDITFYDNYDISEPSNYDMLDLTDPLHQTETYGENGKPYPPAIFEVFRLRCLVYYDKTEMNFRVIPQAVAILRSNYEVIEEVFNYQTLGWLPIAEWSKTMNLKAKDIIFAKRFYRDLAFDKVNVFKREWTIHEVVGNMMDSIRKQSETIVLNKIDDLDGTKLMPSSDIHHIGMDEVYAMQFDSFDEKQEFVLWLNSDFKGIRLTLDWTWNKDEKAISIKQQAFAPIHAVYNAADEVVYYNRLFIKKVKQD